MKMQEEEKMKDKGGLQFENYRDLDIPKRLKVVV